MYSIWIHVVAFFQVVVMNCIQPVNWKYCLPVHEWLLPDIIRAIEIKTGKYVPYQEEKEYLKKFDIY